MEKHAPVLVTGFMLCHPDYFGRQGEPIHNRFDTTRKWWPEVVALGHPWPSRHSGLLGNCSCVALDNCSCIVLPLPIHGLVPPASLQSCPSNRTTDRRIFRSSNQSLIYALLGQPFRAGPVSHKMPVYAPVYARNLL